MSDIDVNCKQIIFRSIATFSRVCFVKASLMVEFCAWLKKLDQISSNKLYQRRWHLCNVEFLLPMAVQCIDSLFAKLIFKLIKWNVLLPSIKVLWMEWSWRGSTRNSQFICKRSYNNKKETLHCRSLEILENADTFCFLLKSPFYWIFDIF